MEIKKTSAVPLAKAKEILAKRQEDGELGYEQAQALEHAEKFTKSEPDAMKRMVEALKKHDRITEELAVKVADVAPNEPATLKAILAKERIEISDEEAAAIMKDIS